MTYSEELHKEYSLSHLLYLYLELFIFNAVSNNFSTNICYLCWNWKCLLQVCCECESFSLLANSSCKLWLQVPHYKLSLHIYFFLGIVAYLLIFHLLRVSFRISTFTFYLRVRYMIPSVFTFCPWSTEWRGNYITKVSFVLTTK